MAAVVEIHAYHGATPGNGSVWPNNGRFHRADTDPTTDGATTFIPVPTDTSEQFSWRKYFKLYVTTSPVGSISNLRWYSDGVPLANDVFLYASRVTTAGYVQPSAADNTTKAHAVPSGTTIVPAQDSIQFKQAAPMSVQPAAVLSNPAVGSGAQDYVCMQMSCRSACAGGNTPARVYTYAWDET